MSITPPDGNPGNTFSVSVAGSVEGHLLVGIGNQLITDANALLGAPDRVDLGTPLWNVPALPTRDFVGRDIVLAQLDAVIGSTSPLVTQAIYGLAGIGKTELVLQYAFAQRSRYALVWWIVADDPDRIETGLAALTSAVAALVGKVPPANVSDAAGWAVAYLVAHPGWMLVLDNVEIRADVEPILARVTGGRVLITSRRDVGWDRIVDADIRLDLLTTDAAVHLLAARSHQNDPTTARLLAAELGHMPLALTQMGAYLAETGTPMVDYLDRLRTAPIPTLTSAGDGEQQSIARVWSITLAAIEATHPFAIDVLRTLSVLAPDSVPRPLLATLSDVPGAVDNALRVLRSYSMVSLTGPVVSTHRLVQAVVADHAREAGDLSATLASALAALTHARPTGNPQVAVAEWPQWAALVPHIEALAHCWPADDPDRGLGLLMSATGQYLETQGAYTSALALARGSLAMLEATLGSEHPDVAAQLNNIALILSGLGRTRESVPLLERALAINETVLGPDHPTIGIRLNNLGRMLLDLGRYAESAAMLERALAITEAALGPDHPDVGIRLENLALSLSALGRSGEALVLQERALGIGEAALGPDHPNVAIRLENLAVILWRLGRVHEAVPLEERAVEISEAALGPDHPELASRLDSLAVSLGDIGREAEAVALQQRALAISEAALGLDHPDVALRLSNLAVTLAGLGRNAEAFPLAVRAVAIAGAALTPTHPTTQAIEAVRAGIEARIR